VAGSGHIAGVINAPAARKYQHWTNDRLGDTLDQWFAGAKEQPGSWWPDWDDWLAARSGPLVKARKPGDGDLPVLGAAPGTYVLIRSDEA
jgi:polyhydroxyalkanoate synthase